MSKRHDDEPLAPPLHTVLVFVVITMAVVMFLLEVLG